MAVYIFYAPLEPSSYVRVRGRITGGHEQKQMMTHTTDRGHYQDNRDTLPHPLLSDVRSDLTLAIFFVPVLYGIVEVETKTRG